MSFSSRIAGVGIFLIAVLLLVALARHGYPEMVHTALTRDPPIVGHPKYGRPQTP
jgi:hypothetical protein